jgi:ribosomal peptide maturation radical SAM protein 1
MDRSPKARVALVNSPFASIQTPSIQLGLIKAICVRDGVPVDDLYVNVDFAAGMGELIYHSCCFTPSPEIGEWLFGHAAFGDATPPEPYLERFKGEIEYFCSKAALTRDELLALRQEKIPQLVAASAAELARYDVVAFTSTFQQNVAALALARAAKALRPELKTVMGGANFHGSMGREHFRVFSFIDCVVTGEADHFVSALFKSILDDVAPPKGPGIFVRGWDCTEKVERDPIYLGSMDDLPVPDYTAYFETLKRHNIDPGALGHEVSVPFESSRGCWWGAKHHCTFCGLNSVGMTFRAKSPERVANEVKGLVESYGISRFDATDNIVERKKMADLMNGLADLDLGVDLFYEIKSNVTPEDVQLMRRAGIKRVQPGIESFSSRVLKIMSKGVSGLQNVNALRWMATYGVDPLWNILYGFPGELVEDYTEQAHLIPWIVHLPPPQVMTRINLDRFSPNLDDPELRSQFEDIQPFPSYQFLYPPEIVTERVAYHFTGRPIGGLAKEDYQPFFRALQYWKSVWRHDELTPFSAWSNDRPLLSYEIVDADRAIVVDSRRRPDQPQRIVVEGFDHAVVDQCFRKPTSIQVVTEALVARGYHESDIARSIERLLKQRLIAEDGTHMLALPVATADYLEKRAHHMGTKAEACLVA